MIGSFFATHGEDRLIVTPEETPKLLSEGLKAVEDRNFDTHVGFDLKGDPARRSSPISAPAILRKAAAR